MSNDFDEVVRETIHFLLRVTQTPNKLFAEKTGLSTGAVSNYLKGRRTPTAQVLCKIADFFNMSLDELCGRKELTARRIEEIRRYHINMYGNTSRVEYAKVDFSGNDKAELNALTEEAYKEVKGEE